MAQKDSILNIILNIVKQGSGANDAKADLGNLDEQLSSLGTSILGGVVGFTTLAAAGVTAFNFIKDSFNEALASASEEQTGFVSLNATVQSMGLSASTSALQIRSMAEKMQEANGIFSHDDLERAAQSFLKIQGFDPSNLQKMLGIVQDFAAGSGQSAAEAANNIAMALETGQVRSLHFTAALRSQIQEMIKAGDQAGAMSVIMDTLNSKYGGQAAAQLDTYAGSQQVLKNSMDEFWAAVGEGLVGPGEGYNEWLAKNVQGATKAIEAHNLEKQAIDMTNYSLGVHVATMTQDEYVMAMANHTYESYLSQIKAQLAPERQVADAHAEAGLAASYEARSVALLSAYLEGAAEAEHKLAIAGYEAGVDLKKRADESQFLNSALSAIAGSDKTIMDIEAQLTQARAQGYSETGKHVTDLKTKLADAQEAERISMLKMVDQWIYTQSVMTGKMDISVLLDIEKQQGLITQNEEDMANKWLKYAEVMANNPVYGVVRIDTYEYSHHQGVIDQNSDRTYTGYGAGGQVEPNTAIWNEDASSRPEVFVSGGGYILTKQDAMAALGGTGSPVVLHVDYHPMLSFADEAELMQNLYPLVDRMIQKSKGRS
jgi:hypothetical protein